MKKAHKIGIQIGIILAVILSSWAIIRFSGLKNNELKKPAQILESGWQFYSKPTTLEPPGTVFRIDQSGRKYIVGELELIPIEGKEVIGTTEQVIEAEISVVAKILGKTNPDLKSTGRKIEKLRFEMIGAVREITTDNVIDDVLNNFKKKVRYRKDDRYFVIREARSAKELTYTLTENVVHELGGEGSFKEIADVKGNFFHKEGDAYILEQKFSTPMRVMFLPEEILMVGLSLSGETPEFETVPVKEVLIWTEN